MGSHNENRRALVVAASYSPWEWGRLGAALLPDRLVRRAGFAAYGESWRFLREAPRHRIHVERRGRLTLLEDTDADIGSHEIAVRRGASDVAVFRQCLIQKLYEPLVRLARLCLPQHNIEGAETEVFGNEAETDRWLAFTQVLANEFHKVAGQELILPQLARHAFLVVRVGELTPAARREFVPGGAAGLAALAIPQEYARAWG